jgi:hypothetical protein
LNPSIDDADAFVPVATATNFPFPEAYAVEVHCLAVLGIVLLVVVNVPAVNCTLGSIL